MNLLARSFEGCPYHCTNGRIMNRDLRKWEPCPYCSEKKKELAKEGVAETIEGEIVNLPTLLGVDNQYMKAVFNYDLVIPEGEQLYLTRESMDLQKEVSTDLYLGLTINEKPSKSLCFGLGNKGRIDVFVYPLLSRAYLVGMTVSKFISCTEYNRMLVRMDEGIDWYFESDVTIMLINDGASKADISAAKGLMQTRALKGRATIFVSTWSIEACSLLLGYYGDESMFLATPVFVEYKSSKKKGHSHYINQLTGVENSVVGGVGDDYERVGNDGYEVDRSAGEEVKKKGISMQELMRM